MATLKRLLVASRELELQRPYCGHILWPHNGRMVAVLWPCRGRIVAIACCYPPNSPGMVKVNDEWKLSQPKSNTASRKDFSLKYKKGPVRNLSRKKHKSIQNLGRIYGNLLPQRRGERTICRSLYEGSTPNHLYHLPWRLSQSQVDRGHRLL